MSYVMTDQGPVPLTDATAKYATIRSLPEYYDAGAKSWYVMDPYTNMRVDLPYDMPSQADRIAYLGLSSSQLESYAKQQSILSTPPPTSSPAPSSPTSSVTPSSSSIPTVYVRPMDQALPTDVLMTWQGQIVGISQEDYNKYILANAPANLEQALTPSPPPTEIVQISAAEYAGFGQVPGGLSALEYLGLPTPEQLQEQAQIITIEPTDVLWGLPVGGLEQQEITIEPTDVLWGLPVGGIEQQEAKVGQLPLGVQSYNDWVKENLSGYEEWGLAENQPVKYPTNINELYSFIGKETRQKVSEENPWASYLSPTEQLLSSEDYFKNLAGQAGKEGDFLKWLGASAGAISLEIGAGAMGSLESLVASVPFISSIPTNIAKIQHGISGAALGEMFNVETDIRPSQKAYAGWGFATPIEVPKPLTSSEFQFLTEHPAYAIGEAGGEIAGAIAGGYAISEGLNLAGEALAPILNKTLFGQKIVTKIGDFLSGMKITKEIPMGYEAETYEVSGEIVNVKNLPIQLESTTTKIGLKGKVITQTEFDKWMQSNITGIRSISSEKLAYTRQLSELDVLKANMEYGLYGEQSLAPYSDFLKLSKVGTSETKLFRTTNIIEGSQISSRMDAIVNQLSKVTGTEYDLWNIPEGVKSQLIPVKMADLSDLQYANLMKGIMNDVNPLSAGNEDIITSLNLEQKLSQKGIQNLTKTPEGFQITYKLPTDKEIFADINPVIKGDFDIFKGIVTSPKSEIVRGVRTITRTPEGIVIKELNVRNLIGLDETPMGSLLKFERKGMYQSIVGETPEDIGFKEFGDLTSEGITPPEEGGPPSTPSSKTFTYDKDYLAKLNYTTDYLDKLKGSLTSGEKITGTGTRTITEQINKEVTKSIQSEFLTVGTKTTAKAIPVTSVSFGFEQVAKQAGVSVSKTKVRTAQQSSLIQIPKVTTKTALEFPTITIPFLSETQTSMNKIISQQIQGIPSIRTVTKPTYKLPTIEINIPKFEDIVIPTTKQKAGIITVPTSATITKRTPVSTLISIPTQKESFIRIPTQIPEFNIKTIPKPFEITIPKVTEKITTKPFPPFQIPTTTPRNLYGRLFDMPGGPGGFGKGGYFSPRRKGYREKKHEVELIPLR